MKISKKLQARIDMCFNCRIAHIYESDKAICFQLGGDNQKNMVDTNSLQSLRKDLHAAGLIREPAATFWFGIEGGVPVVSIVK